MNTIDKETAEIEFGRFVEAMDIDLELEGDDEEDKRDFSLHKDRMVTSIMKGFLVILEDGKPVYTPKYPITGSIDPVLKFRRPTGATIKAFNKANQDINAALADMTRKPASFFSGMDYFDYKVCCAVANLFLA